MCRVVLLFLHGGSYTKECWNPIIRRLQKTPLLQRVPCEIAAFDWRFHGEKTDHSVGATLSFLNGDKTKPRVDHPLRVWMDWGLDDLRNEVENLRANDAASGVKTNIVAIGHSMGATAMLQVEVDRPGTFQGIVAFEPVHGKGTQEETNTVIDMLVSITKNRPGEWNSWEEVIEHFKTGKMYRRWNAECLEAYLEQGVRKTSEGKYVLAATPLQEAAIYCHKMLQMNFAPMLCPVTIEHAEKSYFFDAESTKKLADKFSEKVTLGAAIPNTTHSMVVEDPDTCADHIVENLARLPLFQTKAKL